MDDEYLHIQAERSNGLCLLRISGELDIATAGPLAEHAEALLRAVPGRVVVDLSGLTFIDAHGARALITLTRTLTGRQALVATFCPARIRRILDLLGLPLNCLCGDDRPAPAAEPSELVQQVRRARHDAGQAKLISTGALATLADTCIRLASTRERAGLIREQGQQTLATTRAAREQLTRSRHRTTA